MQILKIVIIIADNNDLIDILIMDILCPNRITNQYSTIFIHLEFIFQDIIESSKYDGYIYQNTLLHIILNVRWYIIVMYIICISYVYSMYVVY